MLVSETLNSTAVASVFDIAMSISSFEHDGLGRYGDPLNPDGDIIAMRSTRRLLKRGIFFRANDAITVVRARHSLTLTHYPALSFAKRVAGGVLLLAIPCGADAVVWNIHRVYGPHRLPQLLRGWSLIAV